MEIYLLEVFVVDAREIFWEKQPIKIFQRQAL